MTAFSLVRSRLALGSPCCLVGCWLSQSDHIHSRYTFPASLLHGLHWVLLLLMFQVHMTSMFWQGWSRAVHVKMSFKKDKSSSLPTLNPRDWVIDPKSLNRWNIILKACPTMTETKIPRRLFVNSCFRTLLWWWSPISSLFSEPGAVCSAISCFTSQHVFRRRKSNHQCY